MKTCNKCNIVKPVSEYSKDSHQKDGIRSVCKSCRADAHRLWQKENPEKNRAKSLKWARANKDKLASSENKEARKAWRDANPDKIAAYNKASRSRNPEAHAASSRRWRQANPEKDAARSRQRRALKQNAEGSHSAADVRAIFESQRGLCASCGKKLNKSGENKYHVDHIVPLSKGGGNDKYNLQCLCPTCNTRKSAKHPLDWARENGKLL